MRPRMGWRRTAAISLGLAQARVELLEQEGEADAGEEADGEAEDGAAQRVAARTAPSAPTAGTSTRKLPVAVA